MRILLTFVGLRDPTTVVDGRERDGLVLTLLREESFDRLYLFADDAERKARARAVAKLVRSGWPTVKVSVVEIALSDPTDYEEVFFRLLEECRSILARHSTDSAQYFVCPIAGTPQIHTVWFLLVQSALLPATLLRVREERYRSPHESTVSEIRLSLSSFPKVAPGDDLAIELASLRIQAENLRAEREARFAQIDAGGIVGNSRALREVLECAHRVATSDAPVLLLGETGTGKDLFAEAIHRWSRRAAEPFIPVDCAAIPAPLVESELFGHERGAFTGADRQRPGKFQAANGGTLFLDEIGELPLESQPKLLRALRSRTIQRVGSAKPTDVNVRIIAATHRDLEALVRTGHFRQDLYYRLNVTKIQLPPLRARREDIPLLVRHFLDRAGAQRKTLTKGALRALSFYSWPGNVAQLENITQQLLLSEKDEIVERDLPPEIRRPLTRGSPPPSEVMLPVNGIKLRQHIEDLMAAYVRKALDISDGNRERAAELLGIKAATLRQWLRRGRFTL